MSATPIVIPYKSAQFVIPIPFGGYVAPEGAVVYLDVRLEENSATEPETITLACDIVSGNQSATYTMTGTEITTPGLYDAELRITNDSGLLLYSLVSHRAILFADTLA